MSHPGTAGDTALAQYSSTESMKRVVKLTSQAPSPSPREVGLDLRDRAVAHLDAHGALRDDAVGVGGGVLVDDGRLQSGGQRAPRMLAAPPVDLEVEAIGLDRTQVVQEILRRMEIAAGLARERRAQRRIRAARRETGVEQRLDVARLDGVIDLVVEVRGLEGQALGEALRPGGVVHDSHGVAVRILRLQIGVATGEGGDLRVGLLETGRHALRAAGGFQRRGVGPSESFTTGGAPAGPQGSLSVAPNCVRPRARRGSAHGTPSNTCPGTPALRWAANASRVCRWFHCRMSSSQTSAPRHSDPASRAMGR